MFTEVIGEVELCIFMGWNFLRGLFLVDSVRVMDLCWMGFLCGVRRVSPILGWVICKFL